jgi:hypothetical protein
VVLGASAVEENAALEAGALSDDAVRADDEPKDYLTGTCLYLSHLTSRKSTDLADPAKHDAVVSGNVLIRGPWPGRSRTRSKSA